MLLLVRVESPELIWPWVCHSRTGPTVHLKGRLGDRANAQHTKPVYRQVSSLPSTDRSVIRRELVKLKFNAC
jgi:hypothetical protein